MRFDTAAAAIIIAFASRALADVPVYGQCGGIGYTGETVCAPGSTCVYSNDWYSQCLPGTASTTVTSTTSTRSSSTSTRTSSTTTTTSTRSSTTSTRTTSSASTTSSPPPAVSGIFVATTGNDSNSGTIDSPLKSIQAAVDKAVAGQTIYIRGGTYSPTTNIKITKSGTASAKYTMTNYNNEKVIIDGEALPGTPAPLGGSLANADRGILHVAANYWRFIGLELINGPYGLYSRDASNNYYERLVTRENYESGFQLQGSASNNIILNLDSWGNRDPRKNGESADGLAIKEGSGTGNVVRGARLWNNVDDGLDFFMFNSPILLENTYAWGNGVNRWGFSPFEGDGNGFKLGIATNSVKVNHIVRNCIAFDNAVRGFTDNGQVGDMVITYNTAYNNGGDGFQFRNSTGPATYNLSVLNKGAQVSNTKAQASGNSWNIGGTWSTSSFASVDSSVLKGPRLANGSVPATDFLVPKSTAPSSTIGARIWGV